MTIRRRLHKQHSRAKDLSGVSVAIVGDILHSRVARSNIHLLKTLGANVIVVAPPTLMPNTNALGVEASYSFDDVLASKPDVVMMLRIQMERMRGVFFPSEIEYSQTWGLTANRFRTLDGKTLIMHPGPMNRGLEICSEAADSEQSTIVEQVANGISVRMAVLFKLMSPERYSNV
jgi:aspartate carbamoyltransferase catalytic subunit